MSKSPGIILSSKFARPKSGVFASYIRYMDRQEAVRNKFYENYSAFKNTQGTMDTYSEELNGLEGYIHYMENPSKTSRLFNEVYDQIPEDEITLLKEQFIVASQNGSVMWQDVFSFDNDWLIEQGYLNPDTHQLNERKIHEAVRLGMKVMFDKEQLSDSGIWLASIHYNTDNIHVHVATVEPEPTRETKKFFDEEKQQWLVEYKGTRSRKTLRAMKSAFSNHLLALKEYRIALDKLSKQIIQELRHMESSMLVTEFEQRLLELVAKLPRQKGYRKYGYAEKQGFDFRRELDAVILAYLKNYQQSEYEQYLAIQEYIVQQETKAFGENDERGYKEEILFQRLGNTILKKIEDTSLMEQFQRQKQRVYAVNQLSNQKVFALRREEKVKHMAEALQMIATSAQKVKNKNIEEAYHQYIETERLKVKNDYKREAENIFDRYHLTLGKTAKRLNQKECAYIQQKRLEEDNLSKKNRQLAHKMAFMTNEQSDYQSELKVPLNEMQQKISYYRSKHRQMNREQGGDIWQERLSLKKSMYQLKRALDNDVQAYQNERAYRQLQYKISQQ